MERENMALAELERGIWRLREEDGRIQGKFDEMRVCLYESRAHNAILALQLRLMNRQTEQLERRRGRWLRKALRRWAPGETH